VRAAFSRWYFQRRVELPVTPGQRQHIDEALADPERSER
jgi:ubiquinol-cytochrome c reductase cytochrome b subunit